LKFVSSISVFAQVRDVCVQRCPCNKILHWTNVCFGAHAISQPRRHKTSETFRKVYAMYIRYEIWNVASAQAWDFTAQMLWWFAP